MEGMEGNMEEDEMIHLSLKEQLLFNLENFISANPMNKFYLLVAATLLCTAVHASIFVWARGVDWETSFYETLQTVVTGGFDPRFTGGINRLVYISAVIFGILVFTVLVGFMNEYIMSTMYALSRGKSKIACKNHTLIIGWNESTVRCVCQLASLRRTYLKESDSWRVRLFPWTRVPPSTPLAAGKIVVMCNTKTKEHMDHVLREALLERGISPSHTHIGTDVICRIGDPTEPYDLLRVGAHLAMGILTMMTEEDEQEQEDSRGLIRNGITLKTLLAVKSVLIKHRSTTESFFWDNFRCVLHLENYSPTIEAATFTSPSGHQLVHPLDLRSPLNSMMFSSANNPALPNVILELLNFDGCAFREGDAQELGIVGRTALDCALIWEDAVFCGVVDKSRNLGKTEADFNQGLACNPGRLITDNDRVIFISRRSFPKLSQSRKVPRNLGHVARPPKRDIDTLVCGWRKQWEDGARLAHRIDMLVEGVCPGCNIVFLNMKEDFADILSNARHNDGKTFFQRRGDHWEIQGVRIVHILGDPGDAETLRYVMLNSNQSLWQGDQFEVVIVLGTSAKFLPKKSQDLRMLSTYVLVHRIHAEVFGDAPLHVIGENQVDSTSALAQAVTWKDSKKDLINTQAMFARGLVQCLAFPLMQAAVEQMFHDSQGTPDLRMFPVGKSMIPVGRATFADITRTIVDHADMYGAICLGIIFGNDEIVLAPPPDEVVEMKEGDAIVVIDRGTAVLKRTGNRAQRSWSDRPGLMGSCCRDDCSSVYIDVDDESSDEDTHDGYEVLKVDLLRSRESTM